ncbi:MAG: Cof-type HAD-IIB family hydrolase [Actinomycetota bacterium]|nr:Cof-type HAD-IIB family hydrolase [Actinomycetota bacterium]
MVVPLIRLVATDLDGTVVRSDRTISDRTVAALRRAEATGATVVFVTGRPPRWMRPVAEATGHTGLAICANGALVYDLHSEQIVERFELSVDVARKVLARLREAVPGAAFAAESVNRFSHDPTYVVRYELADPRVAELDALIDEPVFKVLMRHDDRDADELLAEVRQVLDGVVEATHSSPNDCLIEISASGVSKATTLARFCEERGIGAEEVVAFGDMPNDLPLLAWAGTSYAVANAHPDVLAAVERRTASNDDDGVARVLERLFG